MSKDLHVKEYEILPRHCYHEPKQQGGIIIPFFVYDCFLRLIIGFQNYHLIIYNNNYNNKSGLSVNQTTCNEM